MSQKPEQAKEDDNSSQELEELPAAHGVGPLLQRDYWAHIEDPQCSPEDIIDMLTHEFPRFASASTVEFSFAHIPPLEVGDEMSIDIRGYGNCHVRVVGRDARTLTLVTLEDHYEAGRISFSAMRQKDGLVILRIRSRARLRSKRHLLSFQVIGHLFQKQMWVQFLRNVVIACDPDGDNRSEKEVVVQEETQEVAEDETDLDGSDSPTFAL